ncbi:hypothetical protein HDZ31DRAFT_61123 [Schizophyllum fasciatum]
MARTHWLMGSTGKFVNGRLQNDIWFNTRVSPNGRPQLGAQRLAAQCLPNSRVLLFRQIYMVHPQTGQQEWLCHFLLPPITVIDYGVSPSNPPPAPVLVNPSYHWLTDRWSRPLPNGVARPPALVHGYAIHWHHKNMAVAAPGRRMYYIPHRRTGTAFVTRIKVPAASQGGPFRRLFWNTQVQNYRARSTY